MSDNIFLTNHELTRTLCVIVSLLGFSQFFGFLFIKFKLPKVIGEIFGGMLLGPTFLGHYAPEVYTWLFNAYAEEGKIISLIYWFGLLMLMFVSGFEIQKTFSKNDKKIIGAILAGATIIPFIAGWITPQFYDFTPYIGRSGNFLALQMVIAIAVAVTSIPVISKIFIDLDIIKTHFAKIVLTIATIQDIILWVCLAIATGIVSTQEITYVNLAFPVLITFLFFGLTIFLTPLIIKYSNLAKYNFLKKTSVSGYILFICFLFSAVASLLDVNIVFGAFLAGIVVKLAYGEKFKEQLIYIKEISFGLFTPLYFAIVGLKLNLLLNFDLQFFLIFLFITTFFETCGTLLAARIVIKDWLSNFNLAIAMNTRGGPGIVLATVAYETGIINETFFVTLVLIAITTSLMAGTWFRFVVGKGWDLLKIKT